MRIKFNDKIYRLKEIESGVDSLMELVEESKQKYKEGDFLTTVSDSCFILKNICGSKVYDHAFLWENGLDWDNGHCCYLDDIAGYCTPEEILKVISALKKDGKRWNAEKKCIENIPVYKHGDFLMNDNRLAFIFDREGKNGEAHYLFATDMDGRIRGNMQEREKGMRHCGYLKHAVLADSEAIEAIHDGLKEIGKRWNAEKKCIEDIPVYKDGDFVVGEFGEILILKKADGDCIFDHAYLSAFGELIIDKVASYEGIKRHATTEEKQRMIEALAKKGKRWNDNNGCVEDIPKRKFKAGDKVTLKSRCISKTDLEYFPFFDKYIGERLEVVSYTERGNVQCNNYFIFHEDWLEPCSEEPKVGDWVIFWDRTEVARVGMLTDIRPGELDKYVVDHLSGWNHAVKWDGTVDHIEKIRSGKV